MRKIKYIIVYSFLFSCNMSSLLDKKVFKNITTDSLICKPQIIHEADLSLQDLHNIDSNLISIKKTSFKNDNMFIEYFLNHSTPYSTVSYFCIFEKSYGTIFFTNTENHSKYVLKKINSHSLESSDPIYKYIDSVISPPPYQEELFDNSTEEIDTIILDESLLH
ncbi:hypothetical protein [Flammeovirga kamogawensis]|uniref:Uncharacterized protein n=1 Tax=Flammeovirga kamogawensis TaxID=373891 RepID=A0ABX8GT16_9BACT|nr:hypothetical protein [Flammeovirga kamogawensis]MBB6463319.1 hypothetical protein [Flammeovirga kamogawensis]QWG06706.1 hypothetical protein KM029_15535 [Flammeovirga kamogawensis]TRX68528.1 hypothetical protein EO216_10530 [Flammeovirga kamogawensis]